MQYLIEEEIINKYLEDLFPLNRSLTGEDVVYTLEYLKNNIIGSGQLKSIPSGEKVYDWEVPPVWNVNDAYVKNKFGEKIIDFKKNNIHLVSYSCPVDKVLTKEELLKKIHTLPDHLEWIPYRTSYYKKDWGFCCSHKLIQSNQFVAPFKVKIDSEFDSSGELIWLEDFKEGKVEKEILISSYCCHPSLANDNLSGIIGASLLFKYLKSIDTYFSYRLVILPETIGSICFLSQAKWENIIAGMILSCIAGPDKFSIKNSFNSSHWINKAAHYALKSFTNDNYLSYPFIPDGSDERQYSSPLFRINTPSIHKSKYYEYPEYHTSADDLEFISAKNLSASIMLYKLWISNIESYCKPERIMKACEYQLGKRGLYPTLGGAINQPSISNNNSFKKRKNNNNQKYANLIRDNIDVFNWLMHLADGENTNFDIAEKSGFDLECINNAISIFKSKGMIFLKK